MENLFVFIGTFLCVSMGEARPVLRQLEHGDHNLCKILRAPDNGRLEFPPKFESGSWIVLWCPIGGNTTRTFLQNGTLDDILRKRIDLAKLPYGNDKFNGEEKTLEDLTKSHVGTDRENNVNLCKPPVTHVHGGVVIQADQVYSTDTEITHICKDGFEMKGDSKQRCLSNGLWEGDVPVCIEKKWYKNPYIWIIIGLVFSNTSVLFICCVCKHGREQHTTTYNKCEIEKKETETKQLDEQTDLVGEAESAVPELCESVELDINTEEGENLISLWQKTPTPTPKVVLPRPASVSSTGTMKTNVTTTDDESTSANYPAKEENEPKQANATDNEDNTMKMGGTVPIPHGATDS